MVASAIVKVEKERGKKTEQVAGRQSGHNIRLVCLYNTTKNATPEVNV